VQSDPELETWRREWQAQNLIPVDLAERVDREIRVQRYGVALALLVSAAFGITVPVWAVVSGRPEVAVLAAAVWLFIALNWIVSWRLGRGLSRPPARTTAAFLEFSILSCQRRRQAIVAASVLYAVMLVFNLTWIYQAQLGAPGLWPFLTSARVLGAFAITGFLAGLAVWNRRRLGRQLDNLLRLRRLLDSNDQSRRAAPPRSGT
jgi:hypothetical protein